MNPSHQNQMKLNDRELAIVLASLRIAQSTKYGNQLAISSMPQLMGQPEVKAEEIDKLCQKINK